MTDDIVDYNGHTNAGYQHTEYDDPKHFWKFDKAHYETNHVKSLFPEHFGTVPRDPVTFTNVQLDQKMKIPESTPSLK